MSEEKPQSTVKLGLWLTFAAFLLIILVFKNHISEIHFDTQGVSAKMMNQQDAKNLSPEDRKSGSDELTQRVTTLENEARAHSDQGAQPQQPQPAQITDATYDTPSTDQASTPATGSQQTALPNIAGYWMSPIGLTYQVNQYGNYVAISEINSGVVEAVATGQIAGWSFSLPSYNLAGRSGVLSLQVSADQRQMSGQYQDSLTGVAVPIQMSR
ncbi:MAG TPA: hypothetical protein VHD85_19175 [Terracidiphilus sp.]|nr:hypothetical protein [Terracidiphilus sp.]